MEKPLTRDGGFLGELTSGTFNGKLHRKKGNNPIYLLPVKAGKMSTTAFRKFGKKLTVPGSHPNRTNFLHLQGEGGVRGG